MPTTRKQKKSRKSRGLEMSSDIENLDIMFGENHFNAREREGSLNSNLPRRSRSFASNESENEDGNIGRNQRNVNSRTNTKCDRNSVTGNSSAEINRLSSELNSRISRELDEMMNSVNVQIQRAISDPISTQVLPQIQNVIMAGSGHRTRKGWDAPSERPELNSEVQRNLNAKNSLRNEQDENESNNDYPDLNVHDTTTRKIFVKTKNKLNIFQKKTNSFQIQGFLNFAIYFDQFCSLFSTLTLSLSSLRDSRFLASCSSCSNRSLGMPDSFS